MANPLKAAAIRLRDAIAGKALENAEAALLAGLLLSPAEFIAEARKESVFRFSRYDFDAPILLARETS